MQIHYKSKALQHGIHLTLNFNYSQFCWKLLEFVIRRLEEMKIGKKIEIRRETWQGVSVVSTDAQGVILTSSATSASH